MKKFLLATAFIASFISAKAQDSTFHIYALDTRYLTFDLAGDTDFVGLDTSQTQNLWQIGPTHKTILNSQWTSSPHVIITDTTYDYPANNVSSFTVKVLLNNCWGNVLVVNFLYKIDSDSLIDGGMVEVSHDSGQTWMNVVNDPEYGCMGGWQGMYTQSDYVASLGDYGFSGRGVQTANFFIGNFGTCDSLSYWFRFTFASDSIDNNREGWLIDEISFFGYFEGIVEYANGPEVDIGPNPSSGCFHFTSNEEPMNDLSVYDVNGQMIFSSAVRPSDDIDLSFLPNGYYEAIFEGKNTRIVKRLIISH